MELCRRLLNSTKLLIKLKHPKENNMIWFFSDEKMSARIKYRTLRTLPPAMCPTVPWYGSMTSSPKSNGLPAVPTIILWIVLYVAFKRHIPIDVPTPLRSD